jgi:hypothetical protein
MLMQMATVFTNNFRDWGGFISQSKEDSKRPFLGSLYYNFLENFIHQKFAEYVIRHGKFQAQIFLLSYTTAHDRQL